MADRHGPSRSRSVWLWWTGGKDSACALHLLRQDPAWAVRGLIAAVNEYNGRVANHGVRAGLLDRQASAVDLPLKVIGFNWTNSVAEYEATVQPALASLRAEGAEFVAFGDLSSASARTHRLRVVQNTGLDIVFPLWGREAKEHAESLLAAGLRARVCCVDTNAVPAALAGLAFDARFLADLPSGTDPCGENSEFHTFVEWAAGWSASVPVTSGRKIERYGFAYAEMAPTDVAIPEAPQHGRPRTAPDPFEFYDRLRRVRDHVDGHLAQQLDLTAMTNVIPMTPHSFGRFFRDHVGLTFRDWLTARRLDRAAELLRDHNESVTRVSERVGFVADRTFRRRFHDRFGCCPSEFKRRRQ